MSMMTTSNGDRLAACWRIQDCYNCLRSNAGCGWCPQSSTCIPASSLLEPLKRSVCPLKAERWELRTRALGCGCSTTTLLSILVTILCTIVTMLLCYGIWRAQILQWLWRILGFGAWDGWERIENDDGTVTERAWRRGGSKWKLKLFSGQANDEDTLDERRRLLE
ncbi:hypothetical protein AAFC00_000627 [Neodothiora populina]|uniref:PSI domain-containing protein n=1 Tax=Neodothiora populina TaxID=2781224 RepID=A0ABR3PDW9_9PEZI